jgi:hypothetical protein
MMFASPGVMDHPDVLPLSADFWATAYQALRGRAVTFPGRSRRSVWFGSTLAQAGRGFQMKLSSNSAPPSAPPHRAPGSGQRA